MEKRKKRNPIFLSRLVTIGVIVLLLSLVISYILFFVLYCFRNGIIPDLGIEKKDWLIFWGACLTFTGTTVLGAAVYRSNLDYCAQSEYLIKLQQDEFYPTFELVESKGNVIPDGIEAEKIAKVEMIDGSIYSNRKMLIQQITFYLDFTIGSDDSVADSHFYIDLVLRLKSKQVLTDFSIMSANIKENDDPMNFSEENNLVPNKRELPKKLSAETFADGHLLALKLMFGILPETFVKFAKNCDLAFLLSCSAQIGVHDCRTVTFKLWFLISTEISPVTGNIGNIFVSGFNCSFAE